LSDLLENASISYVKWDMNRNMSEIGSLGLPPKRQRETAHRYMLGLYRILEGNNNKISGNFYLKAALVVVEDLIQECFIT